MPHYELAKNMLLRDWFAGMALQGLIGDRNAPAFEPAHYAEHSYKLADAMLEERMNHLTTKGETA